MEFKPVVFRLGNQKYGVDISLVMGIEKEQTIVRVPNAPEFFSGIINLRGSVIPVYSLRKKFKVAEPAVSDPQYIIVKFDDFFLAIEVDEVEQIYNLEESEMHSIPSIIGTGDTSYIRNIISIDEELIIIVDASKLLSEEEKAQADNMAKKE